MTNYDELFADTAPEHRIFADKSALDPLQDPEEVVARDEQQRRLATLLNGIESGYLPATVSIYQLLVIRFLYSVCTANICRAIHRRSWIHSRA